MNLATTQKLNFHETPSRIYQYFFINWSTSVFFHKLRVCQRQFEPVGGLYSSVARKTQKRLARQKDTNGKFKRVPWKTENAQHNED